METICRWLSKLRLAVTNHFRYYFFFCKGSLFISVLVFGYNLVEYAVAAILITYLADEWKNYSLPKAAAIVNVQGGLSSVLVIAVAHVADAYLGRFKMVSISTAVYVVGLVLFWRLTPVDNIGILLVVMILISFGQAAREPPLKAFLADQCRVEDYKQVEARTNIWWRIPRFLGAAVAALVVERFSWHVKFATSVIVMGLAFLFFFSGLPWYHREKPHGSPLPTIFRVFSVAVSKQHLAYSNEPTDYHENDSDQLPLMPNIKFFRWLDKAAIVEQISLSPEEQQEDRKLCTVTQVKEVKLLLTMLPMWATFLTYCLVEATGSTFFFEQSNSMDDRIGSNFQVPLVSFYLIQKFSRYVISSLYELVIPKMWPKAHKLCAPKVRIGIGMMCSCLCCITARLVENQRLHLVNRNNNEDGNGTINMSIFWLTPQFCLLGLMEGLTEDGLVDFFYHQQAKSMQSYGPPLNNLALGIGEFLSVFWMLTFRQWFGDTINGSHLENYYGSLAILCLGNLPVYYCVCRYVYKDDHGEEMSLDQTEEEVVTRIESVENRPNMLHFRASFRASFGVEGI